MDSKRRQCAVVEFLMREGVQGVRYPQRAAGGLWKWHHWERCLLIGDLCQAFWECQWQDFDLNNGVISINLLWPAVDVGRPAPLLHRELDGRTLLLLGIHYLPAIKKEKLLVGRVVLPACEIWMTYASQKKKVMLTLQYFQHSPHITGSTIKKNNCNASSCGTQHVHQ